jgi:F-type H+-transporting ATPase subunit c
MDLQSAKMIGAGLAAIGTGAAAVGVGFVFGSFLQGALRNPAAADGQQAACSSASLSPNCWA